MKNVQLSIPSWEQISMFTVKKNKLWYPYNTQYVLSKDYMDRRIVFKIKDIDVQCAIWHTLFFSRGLRDSISHCVCPSVRLLPVCERFLHYCSCPIDCDWFCRVFGPSVGPSIRRSVTLCERFLHLRSCPIACDWCCWVYGTPHRPCPTHYCPCPTPATNAAVYPALF